MKMKVKAVEDFIMRDRRVSMRQVAPAIDLSVGSVETINHERLHMSKFSARWVPRMLTPEQIKTSSKRNTHRIIAPLQ